MGARNVDPVNGGGDWICTLPDHWLYEGTGMKLGDTIPGLIGWEYHGDPPDDLKGLLVVAEGTALQGGRNPQQWASTVYPGPAGTLSSMHQLSGGVRDCRARLATCCRGRIGLGRMARMSECRQ